MTEPIYATGYPVYRDRGWTGTIKLKARTKGVDKAGRPTVPAGFTGHNGVDPSGADCYAWAEEEPDGNHALRLDDTTIGIDTDHYGGKNGGDTIAEAEKRWGKLPYSPRSSSRDGDQISGIRLYRIRPGVKLIDRLKFPELGLGGVEIIQRHHRFVVCWPSIHPEGRRYRWWGIDGGELPAPPAPGDIPDLPPAWLEALTEPAHPNGADLGDQPADPTVVDQAITDGEPSHRVAFKLGQALTELHNGDSRHDGVRDRVLGLLRMGKRGEPGVKTALTQLRKAFGDVAEATGRAGGRERALYEFREFIYKKVDGRWVARRHGRADRRRRRRPSTKTMGRTAPALQRFPQPRRSGA